MRKLKEKALLIAVSLMLLTPVPLALADNYSYSNSTSSLAYGHDGVAHYTSYSVYMRKAYTTTWVFGHGSHTDESPSVSTGANSSVIGPEGMKHSHTYGGVN